MYYLYLSESILISILLSILSNIYNIICHYCCRFAWHFWSQKYEKESGYKDKCLLGSRYILNNMTKDLRSDLQDWMKNEMEGTFYLDIGIVDILRCYMFAFISFACLGIIWIFINLLFIFFIKFNILNSKQQIIVYKFVIYSSFILCVTRWVRLRKTC